MSEKPNPWAEAAYPGDPLAHLRWWCDASDRARRELAGVLADRDRLRADLASCTAALGDAKRVLAALKCGVGPAMLIHSLRAELAAQKAATLAVADRLRACSECLGRAAERGKVCQCSVQQGVTA